MTPVPSLITAEAVRGLEARVAELASKAGQRAATAAGGLGTASRETGGAEASPVAQPAAFAIATTTTAGCSEQSTFEELYDAVYNLGRGTPALARMIVSKMIEDNADVEELLDDVQLLRETVDDAFSMIMMMPQFRGLRSRTFANGVAEMAAIDALAADLLDEEMKAKRASGHETAGAPVTKERKLSEAALAAAPPGGQKPMLEASLHAAVSEFKPNEPKLARVIVNYFMGKCDNVDIMGLLADRRLLQLEIDYFLDVIYKGQQEPPVAMVSFAVAADSGRDDAASSPPRAERDTCSRKACKKKRRQRKTTNNAGAAGSR